MDELPPKARAFLADVRGAHNPHDPGARGRIEQRLMTTLALGSSSAQQHAAMRTGSTTFSPWLGSSKPMLASVVLTIAASGAWLSIRSEAPQVAPTALTQTAASEQVIAAVPITAHASAHDDARPQMALPPREDAREAAATPPAMTEEEAAPQARRAATNAGKPATSSSLAEEAALLARAADQLGQRNARAAASLLAEHGRRYPHSQLHEEREGFLVMSRCLRELPEALGEARAFVAEHPASVLVPRLSHLCGL